MTLMDASVLQLAPAMACFFQENSATLRSGGRNLRYEGRIVSVLGNMLPLVDGERNIAGIVDEMGERWRPVVFRLCSQLLADGMVMDIANPDLSNYPGGLLGEWSSQEQESGTDGAGSDDRHPIRVMRVAGSPGEVEAISRVSPAHWEIRAVNLSEIVGVPTPSGVCTTVWVKDPNDELLAEWNETAYHNRQPWLPISHYDGEAAVVGPYVYPKSTPCFECYRRRRASRNALGSDFLELRNLDERPLGSAALTTVLAGLGVAQLQEWENRANPYVPGGVRTVTFERGVVVSSELVLRVPRCSACRPGSSVARPTLWTEYFSPEESTDSDAAEPTEKSVVV